MVTQELTVSGEKRRLIVKYACPCVKTGLQEIISVLNKS